MLRRSIVPFALLALAVLGGGLMIAQDKAVKDPQREADRLAIDKVSKAMIRAFEKRDASAIAANWTEDGEFVHNDGEPVRGRAAIQAGYAEFFKTLKGKPMLEVQSGTVRFPSADMAVADSTLRLKNDDGQVVASARQETVMVRDGGRWRVAVVREWDRDVGLDASLKELEWLIGTWQAVDKDRAVTIAYEWDENRTFIRGKFSFKDGAKVTESGMELIGKDNAKGAIRSWVFQSDGGFADGVWAQDNKKWTLDVHGVRADGSELTATVIYARVDPNTLTWQSVNQTINRVPVADTPPVKVTKRTSAK